MSITEIINSTSKCSEICTARMAIAYNLRNSGLKVNEVGKKIKRDHSTVTYLVQKCKDLISVRDKKTIEAVKNYQQNLHELIS